MTWALRHRALTRATVAAQAAYPDWQVPALTLGQPQSFSGGCSAAPSILSAVPTQSQTQ